MIKFNDSYTGQRDDLIKLIPEGIGSVLDIGCGTGIFGKKIASKLGATVTGIEFDKQMAKIAAKNLHKVIVGDLNSKKTLDSLIHRKFDLIVLGDVLEHLIDPWSVLAKTKSLLFGEGYIICSVPNVRYIDTITSLLIRGVWPYRDRGSHDRTHLRFFTKKDIYQLFKGAGLKIINLEANYRLVEHHHWLNKYARWLAFPLLEEFLAYQYLIIAVKNDSK